MDRDDLYRNYMTIVFGLVATKGLEQLADRAFRHALSWSQALFFLGAFIVGIHYWYACVDYAKLSKPTYDKLSKPQAKQFWKNVSKITFFGVPVLFVSAYAGSVVMFFYAIPERYDLLFRAFWVLLFTSSINDVWDYVTTRCAGKGAFNGENKDKEFKHALKLTKRWLLIDGVYFVIFFFLVNDWVVTLSASRPLAAGLVFLGLIAVGVVLDAAVTPAVDAAPAPAATPLA